MLICASSAAGVSSSGLSAAAWASSRVAGYHRRSGCAQTEASATADSVREGCIVGVKYDGDPDVETYLIGSIEERRDNLVVMSPGSPMGRALLGARKGETVKYEAPGGLISVTVMSIDV